MVGKLSNIKQWKVSNMNPKCYTCGAYSNCCSKCQNCDDYCDCYDVEYETTIATMANEKIVQYTQDILNNLQLIFQSHNILFVQNYYCCQNCAFTNLLKFSPDYIGCIFYTQEDLEFLLKEDELYLGFFSYKNENKQKFMGIMSQVLSDSCFDFDYKWNGRDDIRPLIKFK